MNHNPYDGSWPCRLAVQSLASYREATEQISRRLDDGPRANALRGMFCLAVTLVETYFTQMGTEVQYQKVRRSLFDPLLKVEIENRYRSLFNKKARFSFGFNDQNIREIIYSDFSSITINRKNRIDQVMEALDGSYSSASAWSEIRAYANLREGDQADVLLELLVERRNLMMHYGDRRQGFQENFIDETQVVVALDLVEAIVMTMDRYLTMDLNFS